ncbi:hypothetical protein MRX96_044231 [Rhipicephalus microplus]
MVPYVQKNVVCPGLGGILAPCMVSRMAYKCYGIQDSRIRDFRDPGARSNSTKHRHCTCTLRGASVVFMGLVACSQGALRLQSACGVPVDVFASRLLQTMGPKWRDNDGLPARLEPGRLMSPAL